MPKFENSVYQKNHWTVNLKDILVELFAMHVSDKDFCPEHINTSIKQFERITFFLMDRRLKKHILS